MREHTLNGKIALVTGGSRGIGAAIAKQLGRCGAHVVITFLNSKDRAVAVFADIHQCGGSAEIRQCDVTDDRQISRLVSDLVAEKGAIDILINNAGAIHRPSGWREQPPSDVRASIDLNFTAHLLLSRLVAAAMMENHYGRIVNVSSTYGIVGTAQALAYACAKSALISLTYALAREFGPHGITVNCIAPGNIDTDMTKAAPKEVLDWAIKTTPVGRLGQPEEVAAAVEFLATSEFINGSVLLIDGGQILNM